MSEREGLYFEDNIGDGVEFVVVGDKMKINVHSDWAGDTETGFGEDCTYYVTKEQAQEVCDFLARWIAA